MEGTAMHKITLEEMQRLHITLCSEILSFNENEIVISAQDRSVIIKGQNLMVEEMSKTKGEAVVVGDIIESVMYTKGKKRSKEGMIGRIFK